MRKSTPQFELERMLPSLWLAVGVLVDEHPAATVERAKMRCVVRAQAFGLDWETVTSKLRERHVVEYRFMCWNLLYQAGMNKTQIGQMFGRDHATVIYGLKQHEWLGEVDQNYKKKCAIFAKA